jgi:toxin ParE1/3/4
LVELLAAARQETVAAFEWYLERSPEAAHAFLQELETGVSLIAETPRVWPTFEAGTRRYLLRSYPFSIVYRHRGDRITIVAVAHHSRRPGYWMDR